jgi:hypothetical protein
MKRIDYYGRSFTVSDRYADALIGYVDHLVESGRAFGEFFPMRCYTTDPTKAVDVTVQIVSGVPVLVYPADVDFEGAAELDDDPAVIARLQRRIR